MSRSRRIQVRCVLFVLEEIAFAFTLVVEQILAADRGMTERTYSFAGADVAPFKVNPTTGLIKTKEQLDNWSALDTNGDDAYDFILSVSKASGASLQTLIFVRCVIAYGPSSSPIAQVAFWTHQNPVP